jgi:hypothetical protein
LKTAGEDAESHLAILALSRPEVEQERRIVMVPPYVVSFRISFNLAIERIRQLSCLFKAQLLAKTPFAAFTGNCEKRSTGACRILPPKSVRGWQPSV